jgi:hypothetical protein
MIAAKPQAEKARPIARAVKIGLIAFAIVVAGVAVIAWFGGEQETLPFEYEGFD